MTGLDFYLDPSVVPSTQAKRVAAVLQDALVALKNRNG
jgi:hypothetical protein